MPKSEIFVDRRAVVSTLFVSAKATHQRKLLKLKFAKANLKAKMLEAILRESSSFNVEISMQFKDEIETYLRERHFSTAGEWTWKEPSTFSFKFSKIFDCSASFRSTFEFDDEVRAKMKIEFDEPRLPCDENMKEYLRDLSASKLRRLRQALKMEQEPAKPQAVSNDRSTEIPRPQLTPSIVIHPPVDPVPSPVC